MNMNFDSRSLLLAIIVVIFSIVNYTILRDMIYGILLGSHKKKTADKIVSQQKFMQKLTQRYVGANITRHEKAYAKWINIKLAHFLFCIVQLVGLGLVIFLNLLEFWIVAIICGVIVIYNIVLFGLMMKHTASSTHTKSAKGSPWTFEQ
ncbi:MAG: hypothetical protein IKL87_03980 [Oscillospiraceae bacterium]|nr:hypothetical protein [Oscillospiraceae bacterium]